MSVPTKHEPADDTGRAAKAAAVLGAIFAVVALNFYGTRAAISVLVGVAIALANLLTMRAIIRALLQNPEDEAAGDLTASKGTTPDGEPTADASDDPDAPPPDSPPDSPPAPPPDHVGAGRRGGVAWGVFAVLKILVLFGGVWVLLTRNLVDAMPLVVGYGVLPLGIAAGSLWANLGVRR